MSDWAPSETELSDLLTALFDEAAEGWTEDNHPSPEVASRLREMGLPVHGMTVEEFVDAAFDLWERVSVNESSVHRFAADEETTPARVWATIETLRENALSDLDRHVRAHLGQPPLLRAG